jgi:hypothetical protein
MNPGTDRLQRLRFRRRQPSFEVSGPGVCLGIMIEVEPILVMEQKPLHR